MVANILPADPPDPGDEVNRSSQLFQNIVMLHIKLKGMEHRAPCKHIFSPYILNLWVGLNYKKSECGHVAYQKGKEVQTNIEANNLT